MNPLLTFLLLAMGCPDSKPATDDGTRDSDTPDTGLVGRCATETTATATWCTRATSDGSCPTAASWEVPFDACEVVVCSIDGEGTADTQVDSGGDPFAVCCYPVTGVTETGCVDGRPLTVEGVPRVVHADHRDWGGRAEVAPLPLPMRRALAHAWTRAALVEHASIAAFARLSLDLLALGAPADLVRDAQRAGADEVRHAADAFALASGFAGEPIGPGPMDLAGVRIGADLATLARETVMEGCIGETISAALAERALAEATDPAVRRALRRVVADERRHAALAWRIVAWALSVGGPEVRAAVAAGFRMLPRVTVDGEGLGPWGRLDAATARAVTLTTLREVVGPAAERLAA